MCDGATCSTCDVRMCRVRTCYVLADVQPRSGVESVADIVEAITYHNDRSPTAAANLDAEIMRCVDRLAAQEFDAVWQIGRRAEWNRTVLGHPNGSGNPANDAKI